MSKSKIWGIFCAGINIPGSSNGRTVAFGAAYLGSPTHHKGAGRTEPLWFCAIPCGIIISVMYYVYILRSSKDKKLYIGYTNNLRRRILEHNDGKVRSTNERQEMCLIYYEALIEKSDAKRREKYFKTTKGRNVIKIMLRSYFSGIV